MPTCMSLGCAHCNPPRKQRRPRYRDPEARACRLAYQAERLIAAFKHFSVEATMSPIDPHGQATLTVEGVAVRVCIGDGWLLVRDEDMPSPAMRDMPKRRYDVVDGLIRDIRQLPERRAASAAKKAADADRVARERAAMAAAELRDAKTHRVLTDMFSYIKGRCRADVDRYGAVGLRFEGLSTDQTQHLLDAAVAAGILERT